MVTLYKLDPIIEFDAFGDRIVPDNYTSYDFIYLRGALQMDPEPKEIPFLPLPLFMDKANVTRLNKRSIYPVVLYLICFPSRIQSS